MSYERARTEPSRCNTCAIYSSRDSLSTDLLRSMELTLSVDGCTTNAIELERTDIAIREIGGDATEDRDMALRPSRNRLPPGAVSGQRCAARADSQNIRATPEGQHYREAVESNTLFSEPAASAHGFAAASGFLQIGWKRPRPCLRSAAPRSGTLLTPRR